MGKVGGRGGKWEEGGVQEGGGVNSPGQATRRATLKVSEMTMIQVKMALKRWL